MRWLALGLALLPAAAGASGLSVPVIGTSRSGPAHVDPAAAYWNPAQLGWLARPTLLAGLSLLYLDADYTRVRRGRYAYEDGLRFQTPVPEDDLDASRSGEADPVRAWQILAAPSGFGALPLGSDLVAGVGFFAPFGAQLDFPDDGAQRYALDAVQLLVVEVAPAIAWHPRPSFTVGAGVGLVAGKLQLDRVQDLAGTPLLRDALGNPPIGQPNAFGPDAPSEVRELLVLSRPVRIGPAYGLTWAARAGAAWRPADDWLLGVSYTHRVPLTFRGAFRLDMNDPFFTQDLAAQGLQYPAIVRGKAEVEFPLPSSLHVGAAWQADTRWSLDVSGAWFRHSQVDALTATLRSDSLVQPELGLGDTAEVRLPREWVDTFQVEVRATRARDAGGYVGGLLGLHSGASPDATLDVASPDGPRVAAAAFVGWPVREWLLHGDAHLQYVLPRENKGSRHDLANGTYSLIVGALTVAATRSFE
ncbi:MAG: outer membrane protein transport protein [Myxococcales bacterium]|nr:outer membrane protein transport protein [Myxococcales bacterium]